MIYAMKTTILCLSFSLLAGLMLSSCVTREVVVEQPEPVVVHHYHRTPAPEPADTPENFRAITPPSSYSR